MTMGMCKAASVTYAVLAKLNVHIDAVELSDTIPLLVML